MRGYGCAWEHGGYFGSGNVEKLLGSLEGREAIVCGSGQGVFDDYYRQFDGSQVVFAANDISVLLPRVDHMVSLHSGKLELWAKIRGDQTSKGYGNFDFVTHAGHGQSKATYNWQHLTPIMAISGYFAMQIAYLMGCERIILCGCQGDLTPRFWEKETVNRAYAEDGIVKQLKNEMERLPHFKAAIRSCSGFTRDYFGAP